MIYDNLLADYVEYCRSFMTKEVLAGELAGKTVGQLRGERFIDVTHKNPRVGGMKSSECINRMLSAQAQATKFYERNAA